MSFRSRKGDKPAVANHAPIPGAGEIPPPFPPEEAEIDTYQSFILQEGGEGQELYKCERPIIQTIIRYRERVMCNMVNEEGNEVLVTVVRYVINGLKEDKLAFHNPLYCRILSEATEHIHEQEFASRRFFVAYPDPTISTIATELTSDRYQLSKYHLKTQKLVMDEERLCEMVPMLMVNFKNAIVAEELRHIVYALQDPAITSDNAQYDAVIQRHKGVKEIQSLMARRLDDRVVLR